MNDNTQRLIEAHLAMQRRRVERREYLDSLWTGATVDPRGPAPTDRRRRDQ